MPRLVLDTNVLINFWGRKVGDLRRSDVRTRDAVAWARELIGLHRTDAILTPIYVEYACGQGDEHRVKLARAFLGELELVDGGRILKRDWDVAIEIAHRVLRDGSSRQLGDCLIRAICRRLHLDVLTADRRFPD